MFDIGTAAWPPVIPPPDEVIDCLVEDPPDGPAQPVRWSEYVPDGLLADMLARPADTGPEHREHESLERIGAWERVIAWAQAGQLREIDAFVRDAQARNSALGAGTSQAQDSAVAEVGLMLRVSARTAQSRVDDAWALCNRLPATLVALEQGRITLAKARILHAETVSLSDEHTANVEQKVLAKAQRQTPGQLRAAVRRAVLSTDPAAVRERAEQSRREREVQLCPEPDGMATLSAYLPAADAVGVFAVLDECARRAGSGDDQRSIAARRADALVDLVLGPTGHRSTGVGATREHPTTPKHAADDGGGCRCVCGLCRRGGGVDVRVTVPYTALWGSDDVAAHLAGYGPIPAVVARDLAAAGTWRRILTDPASGRPLDYGATRYRPPAHLAGLVITRDQICQFPGCRVPAHRCDLDHTIPYDPASGTGPTRDDNLGPRCRRHHQLKQTPGWSVTQHRDGATTWTTPSGHSYRAEPPPLTDPEPLTAHPAADSGEPAPF